MVRFVLFAAFGAAGLLAAAGSAHATAGTGINLNVSQNGTVYPGVAANLIVSVDKNSADGVTYHGPFTMHVHMPTGMTLTGSNSGGVWNCPSFGSGVQDVTCTYSSDLTPALWSGTALSMNVSVPSNMPLGTAVARVTVSSAELPLPPTPVCGASPSNTGCVDAPYSVTAASLDVVAWSSYAIGRVATWGSAPFEAGTEQRIELDVRNIGYGPGNGPVVVKVKLPPYTTFAQNWGGSPPFTCSGQSTPDGPIASCTTAYMIDHQDGWLAFSVNIAPDVPVPGTLVFDAGLQNNVQTIPTDCAATPDQTGCGRLSVATRVPRVAYMRFAPQPNDVSHSPHTFFTTQHGTVQVNFTNGGEATAAQSSLVMKLPPYVSFDHALASLPAMTCSSSGTPADGPIVTCTGAGLPAATTGFINFDVALSYLAAAPGPLVIVGGIDAANPATTATLAACTADPNHAHCFWHEIPSFAPCAAQYGDDGVYCDSFDTTIAP